MNEGYEKLIQLLEQHAAEYKGREILIAIHYLMCFKFSLQLMPLSFILQVLSFTEELLKKVSNLKQ